VITATIDLNDQQRNESKSRISEAYARLRCEPSSSISKKLKGIVRVQMIEQRTFKQGKKMNFNARTKVNVLLSQSNRTGNEQRKEAKTLDGG
jgi:hypothetical protein